MGLSPEYLQLLLEMPPAEIGRSSLDSVDGDWEAYKYDPRGSARIGKMAFLRNLYHRAIRSHHSNLATVLVVDMDLGSWSLDGVANTYSRWGEWDAVGSYGMQHVLTPASFVHGTYYDTLALVGHGGTSQRVVLDEQRRVHERGRAAAGSNEEAWVQVESAFGGLAVYSMPAFLARPYRNRFHCEHIAFHEGLQRVYQNANMLALYDNNRKVAPSIASYVQHSFLAW